MRVIFVVETEEGSEVQAEDGNDSGCTQKIWDFAVGQEPKNTERLRFRVRGLDASMGHSTGGVEQMLPHRGEQEGPYPTTLNPENEVRRKQENVVWLYKCDTNYSRLCKCFPLMLNCLPCGVIIMHCMNCVPD